jgi:hypothetical protein
VEALLTTGRQRARSKINWRRRVELVIALAVERELVIVLAAELGPGIVPVAVELGLARAEAALEHDPVAALGLARGAVEQEPDRAVAERVRVPVEAVLAQGHPRGQPGVAPRTKSVTAAHRRGLVPLLAAGDLAAAAAETTREPAAAEAVIAWEVAE